jgi:hypothetical protein
MKLLYPVLFAAYVFAEGEDCFDDCEDGDMACLMACDARSGGKKFSHIVRMVNANVNTAFSYSEMVKRISNYGCHCFPGSSRSAIGYGQAVDQIDEACRSLQQCHKCVDIDFNNACDVDFGRYRYDIDAGTGAVDCSRNSGCKLAQCLCDAEFAYNLGSFWDDANHNEFYWLSKRNKKVRAKKGLPIMDPSATCVQSCGMNVDTCCGDNFPNKKPFDSSARSCCAVSGATYDFATQECCADGSIRNPGSC